MWQEGVMGGGGDDWYNVILLTTAPGAAITITDGDEEIEATGTGSQQAIAIHDESATYTISVAVNGFTKSGTSITTGTTSGVIFEREVAFAEVTLTYDDDFRGETGTISDGTTTANYTFPASDNETTIYIPSTGTWNVYCTVSGEQYKSSDIVVTSLSDSYTSDIHVRPNGKTVTPTDDIQKWLECGGIKGKFYTTLDEVLADHETLQKLISDENAVDYMVRSKSWIKQEALVPVMTSNTTPEGQAYASSEYSSAYAAWKAFDNTDDYWSPSSELKTGDYIGYKFTRPKIVKKVKYRYGAGSARSADISIKAGNDLSNMQEIKHIGTLNYDTTIKTDWYVLDNTDAYLYWEIYVNSGSGSSATGRHYELQFYSLDVDHGITEDETAMRYIGKRNYAADTLLADSNPNLVPVMTDNTTPEGECISSGADTGNEAYHAFDGIPPMVTGSPIVDYWTVSSSTGWLGYVFDTPKVCKEIKFFPSSSSATRTTTVTAVEGSVDGVNYTPITFSGNVTNVPSGTYGNIILDNDTAYKAYKVSLRSSDSRVIIQTMDFLAKPADEPQWLDAICDSEYKESILNVKVPAMTGITTPSGEVFSIGELNSGTPAWHAFDGDHSDGWVSNTLPATDASYIGYDFGRNVKIVSASINNYGYDGNSVRIKNLKVQGSNNKTSGYVDLYTDQYPNVVDQVKTYNFTNDSDYQYYRFLLSDAWSGAVYVGARDIQFEGREDVDETKIDIYGAAGAAVSYKNGNSWSPLTTLENDGHKQIAKSSLPAGVSQLEMKTDVAKDPDDLTADYTKKVNIFDNMIEMMLMPENALYWYGYEANGLEDCNAANGWTTSAAYGTNGPTRNTTYLTMSVGSNSDQAVGTKNVIESAGSVNAIANGTSTMSGTNYFGEITASIGSKIVHGSSVTNYLTFTGTGSVKKFTYDVSSLSNFYSSIFTSYGGAMDVYGFWLAKPNPASNFFSAAKDTVYYTQGGIDIVVAETDDWGGAIVDLTKIPDGVTLYSSVAKDPDSLATTPAAYSKVYHEPVSGKFYLMPSGDILYWYGYVGENCEDCTTDNGWSDTSSSGTNTPIPPVHNINSVSIESTAQKQMVGVGSKITYPDGSGAHSIVKGTKVYSGNRYGGLVYGPTKNMQQGVTSSNYNSNQTLYYTLQNSSGADAYFYSAIEYVNNYGHELYALWVD